MHAQVEMSLLDHLLLRVGEVLLHCSWLGCVVRVAEAVWRFYIDHDSIPPLCSPVRREG